MQGVFSGVSCEYFCLSIDYKERRSIYTSNIRTRPIALSHVPSVIWNEPNYLKKSFSNSFFELKFFSSNLLQKGKRKTIENSRNFQTFLKSLVLSVVLANNILQYVKKNVFSTIFLDLFSFQFSFFSNFKKIFSNFPFSIFYLIFWTLRVGKLEIIKNSKIHSTI